MNRKIIIGCIGLILLINVLILPASGISLRNLKPKNETEIFSLNDLEADLKIRKPGGNWEDEIVAAVTGSTLEFKIIVETNREYKAVAVGIKLPSIDDSPMFNYDWGVLGFGSSEPKPIFPIGEWSANNTDVCWAWFLVDASWSKTMTFNAWTIKDGTESVELTVYGLKDLNGNYDEVYDSVTVLSKKNRFIDFCQLLHPRMLRIFNIITNFI
ncbi:MAG: hypothetical protein KAW45_02045 [Thermoplasmatales archaeon]|nr:hypothetical protein [Thermoplasmatales archaeon]